MGIQNSVSLFNVSNALKIETCISVQKPYITIKNNRYYKRIRLDSDSYNSKLNMIEYSGVDEKGGLVFAYFIPEKNVFSCFSMSTVETVGFACSPEDLNEAFK